MCTRLRVTLNPATWGGGRREEDRGVIGNLELVLSTCHYNHERGVRGEKSINKTILPSRIYP